MKNFRVHFKNGAAIIVTAADFNIYKSAHQDTIAFYPTDSGQDSPTPGFFVPVSEVLFVVPDDGSVEIL